MMEIGEFYNELTHRDIKYNELLNDQNYQDIRSDFDSAQESIPVQHMEYSSSPPITQNNIQPNLPQPNLLQPNLPQPNLPQPNLPQPNLPQPNIPQPNLPQPNIPQLPQPNIPQPNEPVQPNIYQYNHQPTFQPSYHIPRSVHVNPSETNEPTYMDKMWRDKRNVLKLLIITFVILLAISLHATVQHYINHFVSVFSKMYKFKRWHEVAIRVAYPLFVLAILWHMKVFWK